MLPLHYIRISPPVRKPRFIGGGRFTLTDNVISHPLRRSGKKTKNRFSEDSEVGEVMGLPTSGVIPLLPVAELHSPRSQARSCIPARYFPVLPNPLLPRSPPVILSTIFISSYRTGTMTNWLIFSPSFTQ